MIKKNENGSVLVYALGVIAFVSILLLGLVQLITAQARFGRNTVTREKAFQVVESCAHEYRWYLAHNTDGHTVDEVDAFWHTTGADEPRGLSAPYSWDFKTQTGELLGGCIAKITTASVSANTPIEVEFTGFTKENESVKSKIKLRFRRTSWSDYVVLSDEFASFDSSWDISGKIMSNAGVRFEGVARGKVTAGSSEYEGHGAVWSTQPVNASYNCEYNTPKASCVFSGGKRYPVPEKDFNGIAVDLNLMRTYAKYPSNTTVDNCYKAPDGIRQNCYFSASGKEGYHLILKVDGTFDLIPVKDVKSNSNDIRNEILTSKKTFDIPQNGVIFVDDTIWVEGKLNEGRVTVVAAGAVGNIYIGGGDLKYVNKDNNTVAGLIAKGNILLTSEKTTCNGSCTSDKDLEIDAAMLAKDGMVGKQDFNPHCCGGGCETQKNRLDIFGSVVSRKFIEFTVSKECNAASKVGFNVKNIEYDNNLFLNPPPFFPSDVYYTVDLWQEI